MNDPLRVAAVVFDWAGTVVDHGCQAPVDAFVRAFAAFDVAIDAAEARAPMGMAKWDHIRAVGTTPRVTAAWRARHGRDFGAADVDAIFRVFEPMSIAAVREHAALIPGVRETVAALIARKLRVAATTGYTRAIMDVLEPLAAAAGYAPELTVCAGDLPAGRPSPLMMWYAMARLGVWPAARVVKVDDTAPGIGEGAAAGTWTVGVALTGNAAAMSAAALAALPDIDRRLLRQRAAAELGAADFVIDSVAELPDVIAEIDRRLADGGAPRGGEPGVSM